MKITKLLGVEDTRELIEDGDRWIRVSGTGVSRNCDRCNRAHEVHAHVELEDGTAAIVGTGCMRADDLVQASTVRSALRRSDRKATLERKISKLERDLLAASAIAEEVERLPAPPIVRGTRTSSSGETIATVSMGGTELWCTFGDRSGEELELSWRSNETRARLKAAGLRSSWSIEDSLRAEKRALAKLLKVEQAATR